MKKWWELTDSDISEMLKATEWSPANLGYFRGGGFSSRFATKADGMPVTLIRMNSVEGIGVTLQIAEGWTVDLPDDMHKNLLDRTDPTWPSTWFVPRLTGKDGFESVYSVMEKNGAQTTVHSLTVT